MIAKDGELKIKKEREGRRSREFSSKRRFVERKDENLQNFSANCSKANWFVQDEIWTDVRKGESNFSRLGSR